MMVEKEQKRIFIGGLVKGVTEKELVEKFSRFGEVGQIEIKTRDGDLDTKTFAYLNLKAGEKDLKKCFTAYNNTKWKGGQLKLQFAKESFLNKLKQEQAVATKKRETTSVVEKKEALEVHNKKAVPGTHLDDEGKWVMGKYSRALPVLRVKKPSSRKVVTLDPSKMLHTLKKLKSNDAEGSAKTSDLTWQMDENDNDITKKRKGEFWGLAKKEPVVSRLQKFAAEEYVSDTELEVVPCAKTATKTKLAASISVNYNDCSDSAGSADTDEIITKASGKKPSKTYLKKATPQAISRKDAISYHCTSLVSASSDEKAATQKSKKKQPSKPSLKNIHGRGDDSKSDNEDSDSTGSADLDEITLRTSHEKSVEIKPGNTSFKVGQLKTKSAKIPNVQDCDFDDSDMSVASEDLQYLNSRTSIKKKVKEAKPDSSVKDMGVRSPSISGVKTQPQEHKSEMCSKDSVKPQSKPQTVMTSEQKPVTDSSDSDSDLSRDENFRFGDTPEPPKAAQLSVTDTRTQKMPESLKLNSDSSDTDKRPKFHFLKTITRESKCLRKSCKLVQTRTPPFRGLSMLSIDIETGVKECMQSTASSEKEATDNVGDSAVTEDEKEDSTHIRDAILDKKVGRKALDGLAFIQKSHQARQKNLVEVKKQENLITKSIREGTSSKHVRFSDSEDESSSKKQHPAEAEKKTALSLFEDSTSEEEGDRGTDHDFSIRPQFEGKKGQKLRELQSKIKDSRFKMDERFAESDSEREELEKDPDEKQMAEEKARNLKILEQVLGFRPRQRRESIYQGVKRYLDPVQSRHLEINPETAIAQTQAKKLKLDSDPEVSHKATAANTKPDSGDENSKTEDNKDKNLEDSDSQDEEKATDESSHEEEEDSKKNSGDKEKEEEEKNKEVVVRRREADDAKDLPTVSNESNLGGLFSGGSSFTFFGMTVEESPEEAEMNTEPSFAVPRNQEMAVRVEAEGEGRELQKQLQSTEHSSTATHNHQDKQKPSFVIAKDDPRLQAAVKFFQRPPEEEFRELITEWPEQRQKIMQIVRDRHKRSIRKEKQTQRQEQWKRKQTWKKGRK